MRAVCVILGRFDRGTYRISCAAEVGAVLSCCAVRTELESTIAAE